ncbi:MAG: glycoside hydrolase family 9 protein [Lachnospiraceae bacterium]|nr:glycoside hydrolase family 9 protein [Lachnospiraceae bacterium]
MNSIRMNQMGLAEKLPKTAVVTSEEPLVLSDGEGSEIRRFDQIRTYFDVASGDRTAKIPLPDLPCGTYRLRQGESSIGFSVKPTPYRTVLNGLIKGMYYQRCGCELSEKYAGKYTHAACHMGLQRLYSDPDVVVEAHGGWHDAGDFGKYIGPGAVAVAHMLYAWRIFPDALTDELNIPESGNGTPDILNECRYELMWMLKMQREDGALYHKLTKKRFAEFIMPEEDFGQEYLIPPSYCATAAHAAAAALAFRCYQDYDPDFAAVLLESAEKAWNWIMEQPAFVPYNNPEDVRTGEYGDQNGMDETFWAAAELYAATGEVQYLVVLTDLMPHVDIGSMGWREVGGLGSLCCIFDLKGKLPEEVSVEFVRRFLLAADQAAEYSARSGYGTALDPDNYIWGSILPIMGNGMVLIAAYLLSKKEAYRDAAQFQLDYLLGLNALDVSFVTGFGTKPYMNPHHRQSASDGIEDPVPGLVSGGPNKKNPSAIAREKLNKKVYPAKYWLDETMCPDQNEIAIYWNSPAIFVAAAFDAFSRRTGT